MVFGRNKKPKSLDVISVGYDTVKKKYIVVLGDKKKSIVKEVREYTPDEFKKQFGKEDKK